MRLTVFSSWKIILLLILLFNFSTHYYFLGRFGGRTTDSDSGLFFRYSERIQMSKEIIYKLEAVYPNGFGWQVFSVLTSFITGLNYKVLYYTVYPLHGAIAAMMLFVLVREYFHDNLIALTSTMLLSLQSDFLFITIRSTHERFFVISFILMLICLKRSFSLVSPQDFRRDIFMIYCLILQMLSLNIFFASSVITAILVSMILGLFAYKYQLFKTSFMRLSYVALIGMFLAFYFMFFIYPPARSYLGGLSSVSNQAGLLFVGIEEENTFTEKFPQYKYVKTAYEDTRVFLGLRLYDFVVIPLAFISATSHMRRLSKSHDKKDENMVLLLFMYFGFFLIFIIAILFDRVGTIASNIELRIFPYLHILSAPFAGHLIVTKLRDASQLGRKKMHILFIIFIVLSSIFSILKATNEPRIIRNWVFFSNSESRTIHWMVQYPHEQSIYTERFSLITFASENYTSNLWLWGGNKGVIFPTSILEERWVANYGGNITQYFTAYNVTDHNKVYDSGYSSVYWVPG